MAWIFPILSGLLDAASRGVIKHTKVSPLTLISRSYIFALPYYLVWLWFAGIPNVSPFFWTLNILNVYLGVKGMELTVRAHRATSFILTAPYLSLTPAFLLFTTPVFIVVMGALNLPGVPKGAATLWGITGVIVLTGGIYLLNLTKEHKSIWRSLRMLMENEGSRLMCVVAFLWAITTNLDYIGIQNANMPFQLLVNHGGIVVLAMILSEKRLAKESSGAAHKNIWWAFALYGSMIAAQMIFHFLSFAWIPVVSYVIAGKRTGAILFTVASGLAASYFKLFGAMYEGERQYLHYRIPGLLLMIGGMLLVIFEGMTN